MSIQITVDTYSEISDRLVTLRKEEGRLLKRKKELERDIIAYLDKYDLPGFKINGKIISRERRKRIIRPPLNKTKEELTRILSGYGVRDITSIINDLSSLDKQKESSFLRIK